MSDRQTRRPRLVLTGAMGSIGSRIAPALNEHYDLIPADLRPGEGDQVAEKPVRAVDATDFEATCDLMQGADYVVHTVIAREQKLKERGFETYVNEMMRINGAATHFVLEAAHRAGVKRVVVFSSIVVLKGSPSPDRITDQSPLRPRGLYGCLKLLNENVAECYHREKGLSVICLRPGAPYYGDSPHRAERLKKRPRARGLAVHIDDIALAVHRALTVQSVDHAVVNLLSASDQPWVALTGADLIGYRPTVRFTEHGVERLDQPQSTASAVQS